MTRRVPFFLLCICAGILVGGWLSSGKSLPELRQSLSATTSKFYSDHVKAAASVTPPAKTVVDKLNNTPPPQAAGSTPVSPDDTGILPYSGMPTTGVISYHEGIMKVAPSVVSLYASSSTLDQNSQEAERTAGSQGSGVIVDADGVVLTNLHLVEGLDRITVVLSDGRRYPAILIGSDRETDLAVVRIAATNLPFVALDDAPPLRVGDVVLAIGNPFGVGQTVTQGIVSATRRRIAGGSVWQHFVQIDAAINPGNSGGALINPYGQLVGVNTAVFRGDSGAVGIGFSIPADLLAQVVPQIIEYGSVARGWLGIGVEDLSMFPALASKIERGAVVIGVLDDSPASRVGLHPLDVVTAINGVPISSATQLLLAISREPPGTPVVLTVLRNPDEDSMGNATDKGDLENLEMTPELGTRPDLGTSKPR
ncbi:S1C family serine protease [Granulosicoccus antarcticus]|uniref:Periplasmic serine endoprotease DegP n=1 Tax=Granulosicoccus antarcticus IMCC3135 TaxID=1192854 RepID=A0A2Z2NWR4_9GAMM|nr:trypsin-like peptidase domain-containing protein [Granulosicoccus antarcticus]ASJ75906.1 Periplasmic serine endoprotease DegP [Granulosicoccus antarcticus IMCC3135]